MTELMQQELEFHLQQEEQWQAAEHELYELLQCLKHGGEVDRERLESLAHGLMGDAEVAKDIVRSNQPRSKMNGKKKTQRPSYFDMTGKFRPVVFAKDVLKNELTVVSFGNALYYYDKGLFRPDAEKKLRQISTHLLGDRWKSSYIDEGLNWIKSSTLPCDDRMNPDDNFINVKNGLVNWRTGELLHHTTDRLSTIQLPVEYDPNANDPAVLKFIQTVMPEDTVDTVLEMIGYCLTTHTRFEKAIMFIGSGANGKSTFINMLTALIGLSNTSNVSLQDLEKHRFKPAELVDKLINTVADLPLRGVAGNGVFKAVVSGDLINAERKNKDPFSFRPFAKLIFSTNEFPRNEDMTDGFFRRWLIIPFEKKFTPDQADVNLIDKLTTQQALSTLLNYAIEGLRRLENNGKFTESETITKTVEQYRYSHDNVKVFIDECCVTGENQSCKKDELYVAYQEWIIKAGLKALGKINFNKRIQQNFADTRKKGESNKQWVGIAVR